jgi:hypothetical protein
MTPTEPILPRDAPLATYQALFRQLPPVAPGELRGRFDAVAVGPAWYRALFRALLVAGGLRGWVGKEFGAGGEGANLCRRGERVERRSRMRIAGQATSSLDGGPALLLRYRDLSPLRLVHDELRRAPDGTFLGFTYLALGPLRRVQLPFAIAPAPAGGSDRPGGRP